MATRSKSHSRTASVYRSTFDEEEAPPVVGPSEPAYRAPPDALRRDLAYILSGDGEGEPAPASAYGAVAAPLTAADAKKGADEADADRPFPHYPAGGENGRYRAPGSAPAEGLADLEMDLDETSSSDGDIGGGGAAAARALPTDLAHWATDDTTSSGRGLRSKATTRSKAKATPKRKPPAKGGKARPKSPAKSSAAASPAAAAPMVEAAAEPDEDEARERSPSVMSNDSRDLSDAYEPPAVPTSKGRSRTVRAAKPEKSESPSVQSEPREPKSRGRKPRAAADSLASRRRGEPLPTVSAATKLALHAAAMAAMNPTNGSASAGVDAAAVAALAAERMQEAEQPSASAADAPDAPAPSAAPSQPAIDSISGLHIPPPFATTPPDAPVPSAAGPVRQRGQAGRITGAAVAALSSGFARAADGDEAQVGTGSSTHTANGLPRRVHPCTHAGCYELFTRKEHLTRHMRKHTDERPFKCEHPGCNKAFTRSDNCAAHAKTHARAQQNIAAGRAPTAKGPIPKAKPAAATTQEIAKQAVAAASTSAPAAPVASTSVIVPQRPPSNPPAPPSHMMHHHQQAPPPIYSLPFGMAPPMPMMQGPPQHLQHQHHGHVQPMMQTNPYMFDPSMFGPIDFLNPSWPASFGVPTATSPHAQMPPPLFAQPPPQIPQPPAGSSGSPHLSR